MACNQCTNSCGDCGCLQNVPAGCVFVDKTYSCLNLVKGDTFEDVLDSLDAKLCTTPTPSGNSYVGTSGQIDINGNVISLSNAITSAILNQGSAITTVQSCLSNTVKALTVTLKSGLTLTETNSNSCGKTLNLNYTPTPTSLSEKQGIIENKVDWEILTSGYTYSKNLTPYVLKTGDVIKIKGGIRKINIDDSEQSISITDSVTTVTVDADTIAPIAGKNKFIDFEITLPIQSVSGTTTFNTRVKSLFSVYTSSGGGSTEVFTDAVYFGNKITQIQAVSTFNQANFRLIFNNANPGVLENFTVEILRKI